MTRSTLFLFLCGIFLSSSNAQEKVNPPTDNHPNTMLAKAIAKDNDIIVSFATPVLRPVTTLAEDIVDGKKISFTRVTYKFESWKEVELKMDEKTLQAFGVDGKSLSKKEIVKRLGKQTHVAVFLIQQGNDLKPDHYYLGALKEDLVVFVVPVTTFYASVVSK